MAKLLLVILDGQPYATARRLMGNLEGFVAGGRARVWRHRSVLPSVSASCYASIHTGLAPHEHGIWGNETIRRIERPDVFSEAAGHGLRTGAVAHAWWSAFFRRAPFDPIEDLEVDGPEGPIHHGRFHTMTGYGAHNAMTPSDADLLGTLAVMTERHGIDYGLYHSCTLDAVGHGFGQEGPAMEAACAMLDSQLAPFLDRWVRAGYEVIVTADHGQNARGHHGGADPEMRDSALYYFGPADGPAEDAVIDQLALAPTVLARLGVPAPATMRAAAFLA
jgi:predicted AlkP superfamily pyrophosphatase or phosphodiesterase